MDQAIRNFSEQFKFVPEIINSDKLKIKKKFIIIGMGGSHLAADIVKSLKPDIPIIIHGDYSLPKMSQDDLKSSMIILSSYSGNTEEVLSAFSEARELDLDMCAVMVGGKLLELAEEYSIPYVRIPDTGIQPRSALGFSFLALLKIMGQDDLIMETVKLIHTLQPEKLAEVGRELAEELAGHVPIFYTTTRNSSIAYNWKIKFNETGKIPAFMNVVPELNHNEMNGFDVKDATRYLSDRFYFVFLKDEDDDENNKKRMKILFKLYTDRRLPIRLIEMEGKTRMEKIFKSLLLADWAAFYTAEYYGLEAEQVPLVEEFKKLME